MLWNSNNELLYEQRELFVYKRPCIVYTLFVVCGMAMFILCAIWEVTASRFWPSGYLFLGVFVILAAGIYFCWHNLYLVENNHGQSRISIVCCESEDV
jgi:hypothetical protein